jgi:RNA polymerase sigma-70 factor (ECF subfamily)
MAAVLDFSRGIDRCREPFSVLHAQFAAPLRRFFRSYRLNAADVDDLIQEVFIRLVDNRARAELVKPEAYVFTLARNLVRDRARRLHTKALARSVEWSDVELSCERPTPDRHLECSQILQRVEDVLALLKPCTREAFILHRVNGDSYAKIASLMKISVSMVEKHIMCALLALRGIDAS